MRRLLEPFRKDHVTGLGLALALLIISWVVLLALLNTGREHTLATARQQAQTLATVLTASLEQLLDSRRPRPGAADILSVQTAVPGQEAAAGLWYDASLRLIWGPPDITPPSRRFLREAVEQLAQGRPVALGAAQPQEGRLAAFFPPVPVVYPVTRHNGQHLYYVMMLDLAPFLAPYGNLSLHDGCAIRIRTATESLMAVATCSANRPPGPTERLSSLLRAEAQSARHGFSVSIEQPEHTILQTHEATRQRYLMLLSIWSLLILVVSSVVIGHARARQALLASLSHSDREKQKLILQLEDEKQRAYTLAAHDHLTGLPNRRLFQELVSSHLLAAKRTRHVFALLYLDLDQFKHINDSLGHHVGDALLVQVALRLRHTLSATDVVARLGGDEFGLFLTTLSHADEASRVADRILEQVKLPFLDLEGHDIQVSPSIGIALYPRDGDEVSILCKHADAAMYQSKRLGRSRHTLYEPTFTIDAERLFRLEQGLPRAIQDNELVLHYQPKIDIANFRIAGFEALVRWNHPELGLVPPNEFIPIAEHNGLIHELGHWVAQSACQQLHIWRDNGYRLVPIAINVSARQLMDPQFPEQIARMLTQHALPPSMLEIEITESMLMDSMECASQALSALNQLGVRIAIDDFGQGFSSLHYIKNFPVQALKIDRSFIRDIRNSHDDDVIVSSIITLAHNLSLSVIAEGVETLDQLVHLKAAGCDQAQGFLFSKPLGAAEASRQLLDHFLYPS